MKRLALFGFALLMNSPFAQARSGQSAKPLKVSKACEQTVIRSAFEEVVRTAQLEPGSSIKLAFLNNPAHSGQTSRHKFELVATFEVIDPSEQSPTLQNILIQFFSKKTHANIENCVVTRSSVLAD